MNFLNKSFLKKFLVFFTLLVTTFGIFYFILLSPLAAKHQSVIKLRDRYIYLVFNIRKIFGHNEADYCWYLNQPINPIRKNDDGSYNYAIIGRLIEIDKENNTISLKCSNGKTYTLFVVILTTTYTDDWVMIDVGVNTKAAKPKENPFMFNLQNLDNSGELDPNFKKDQLYMAIWTDNRSPAEISNLIKGDKNNPGHLNGPVNFENSPVKTILRY